MTTPELVFDNTELQAMRTCPTKHYWRHVRNLVPARKQASLDFGSAFHRGAGELMLGKGIDAALAAFSTGFGGGDELRSEGAGHVLLIEYAAVLKKRTWRPIQGFASEVAHEVPLFAHWDPESECVVQGVGTHEGDELWYGGRIDGIVEWHDVPYVLDFKTTTRFGKRYYEQFEYPNAQISGYILMGSQLMNEKISGCLVEVVVLRKGGHEFPNTQPIERYAYQLEHFRINTLRTIEQILQQRDVPFPHREMRDNACSIYNGCPYRDLCQSRGSSVVIAEGYMEKVWDFRKVDEENGTG